MESLIWTNIYIFILGIVLALIEIQIEGKHAWATQLPTWRPTDAKWYARFFRKMMSGKELTGYHASLFTFVILVFHLPFFYGYAFTLDHWLKTISMILMFMVLWDFQWMVLNPHYPLKRFTKEYIWWHKKWMLGLPSDYYSGIAVALVVLVPAMLQLGNFEAASWWALNVGLFLLQTVLLILFSHGVLKVDSWKITP